MIDQPGINLRYRDGFGPRTYFAYGYDLETKTALFPKMQIAER
jgi:hypothetical protein